MLLQSEPQDFSSVVGNRATLMKLRGRKRYLVSKRIHSSFAQTARYWPGTGAICHQLDRRAMRLDVNSLFLVTVHVEAMLGLLLLFAWVQNTKIYAVAWWGSAHLLRAASIMLFGMYGSAPEWLSIDFANILLFTAFAVTWTGARVFDGRRPE